MTRTALDEALDTLDEVTKDWDTSERKAQRLALQLRNCLYLAARHKFEGDWAHIRRFCKDAEVELSPLRANRCICGAGKTRPHQAPCPLAVLAPPQDAGK